MGCSSGHEDPTEYLEQVPAIPHPRPAGDGRPEPDVCVITELEKMIVQVQEALSKGTGVLRSLEEMLERLQAGPWAHDHLSEAGDGVRPPEGSLVSPFTAQELRILNAIGQGYSNRRIARSVGISEKTVKNHVYSIFRKLGVHSRTEAVVVALKRGWLKQDPQR
ncbi:response regulator transcription factor [Spirillospora sp. CA-253888]